jgi:L-methionine (R)-S-oxide reductase
MSLSENQKRDRYKRIFDQLEPLLAPVDNQLARMATIVALLHHKFSYFFWTGFYLHEQGRLIVGPYQGSLACLELKRDTGVCWAGVNQQKPLLVNDVHTFPGHIACDARSRSEMVIPVFDDMGQVIAIFDVDSADLSAFSEADEAGCSKILQLL